MDLRSFKGSDWLISYGKGNIEIQIGLDSVLTLSHVKYNQNPRSMIQSQTRALGIGPIEEPRKIDQSNSEKGKIDQPQARSPIRSRPPKIRTNNRLELRGYRPITG